MLCHTGPGMGYVLAALLSTNSCSSAGIAGPGRFLQGRLSPWLWLSTPLEYLEFCVLVLSIFHCQLQKSSSRQKSGIGHEDDTSGLAFVLHVDQAGLTSTDA